MITTTFTVPGIAQPKGSTKSFRHAKTGRIVTTSDNPELKNFEHIVRVTALEAGLRPVSAACIVSCEFIFPRPKKHFGTKGLLPRYEHAPHTVKPDADKLRRAVCDGLTGVAYNDDAQVIGCDRERKRYADPGEPPRTIITVTQLTELE